MVRTFHLLEQIADVVETETGSHRSQISRANGKRLSSRAGGRLLKAAPKRVVDDLPEWPPRFP